MDEKKRIIFFGTPDLAADFLMKLMPRDSFEIVAVVTNPDAPSGRKQFLTPSPVKLKAEELRIPVLTPEKLDANAHEALRNFDPDLFVVVSYGKILPKSFLELPKFGAFNIHFSLLPKYRGASPVQSAILNGDDISGFSIFQIKESLDSGDIFVEKDIEIMGKTAIEVFSEMKEEGAKALLRFCDDILSGKKFIPDRQNEGEATSCKKLKKSDGEISPDEETMGSVLRKYRALLIWPGIFFHSKKTGTRIKLLEIKDWSPGNPIPPGSELIFKSGGDVGLRTADGALEIIEAQPEGKMRMIGTAFWNWWEQKTH